MFADTETNRKFRRLVETYNQLTQRAVAVVNQQNAVSRVGMIWPGRNLRKINELRDNLTQIGAEWLVWNKEAIEFRDSNPTLTFIDGHLSEDTEYLMAMLSFSTCIERLDWNLTKIVDYDRYIRIRINGARSFNMAIFAVFLSITFGIIGILLAIYFGYYGPSDLSDFGNPIMPYYKGFQISP